MPDIVAGPIPTRYPGRPCPWCKETIEPMVMMVKVATQGSTTRHGQGPGYWVHAKHVERGEGPAPQ